MSKQLPLTLAFTYLGLVFAAVVGWIMNIVALVHLLGGPVTAMFVARIVGIPVAILGAILGYL